MASAHAAHSMRLRHGFQPGMGIAPLRGNAMGLSILALWFAVSFALGPVVGRHLGRCAASVEEQTTA
jgi:hypothetical protein